MGCFPQPHLTQLQSWLEGEEASSWLSRCPDNHLGGAREAQVCLLVARNDNGYPFPLPLCKAGLPVVWGYHGDG